MIVDASVAAKWLLRDETDANIARRLRGDQSCIAPDLLLLEVANSCIKRVQRGVLSASDATKLIALVPDLVENLVPARELLAEAGRIAADLIHPIYDCVYLALAEREKMPVVTVDQKLLEAGKRLVTVEVIHLRDL
jgi:predicted nucleic acid-binding protein